MARVDYFAIEEAMAKQLRDDDTLFGVTILVEEELKMGKEDSVIIYLDRREAPADLQTISAGQRTRFNLNFTVNCFTFHLDKQVAMENRDDLIGKVEVALMKDHTFGGTVTGAAITGGDFDTASDGSAGFMSAASIEITARATATT